MSTGQTERTRSAFYTPTGSAVRGTGLAVGLLFVALGLTKFLPAVGEEFARLGVPAWARLLLGAAEFVGGVLFCLPRSGTSGAGVLGATLAGAVGVYFARRPTELPFPLLPIALLVVLGLVTWGRARLARWCRYTAALDRFTAREIGASGAGKGV